MSAHVRARKLLRGARPIILVSAVVASLAGGSAVAEAATKTPIAATQDLVTLLAPQRPHAQPSARAKTLSLVPARTPITGERTTLPVLGAYGTWLLVRLPGRPNGHTGWIHEHATTPSVTAWHLVVDTTTRRVTVYHAAKVVRVIAAVVGKPATPTPPGDYFVEESISLNSTAVGAPFALALSARSNVLQDFDGGPGQIALHGLDNVGGTPGTAASHGCIRLENTQIRWLAGRIGAGTPVTITT
ncbi:MAG TPA: L,D-transpeptidase [Gaiellales bacterium]|jgi:lipoprotein-anchoring transpeptidase ErfK/SrfK